MFVRIPMHDYPSGVYRSLSPVRHLAGRKLLALLCRGCDSAKLGLIWLKSLLHETILVFL